MKSPKFIFTFLFAAFMMHVHAQKIKLIEGSIDALKNDTSFNFEFTYDNMSVGRFDNEADYIAKRITDLNTKQPGSGEAWAKKWISNRTEDYEPKFIELFSAFTGAVVAKDAKHTIIFHTVVTEPGYDAAGGAMIGSSKSATIDAEVTIVETANRSKKIAVIKIIKAPGAPAATFSGTTTNDGALRISEAYAKAGKGLAKFIK